MVDRMTESDWVEVMKERMTTAAISHSDHLQVKVNLKVPYGYEIRAYEPEPNSEKVSFRTDLVIVEEQAIKQWKPRVIIEAKIRSVTTHDAIIYSHKAAAHKAVHPYLRYGMLIGGRDHYPLPGRLYRHGAHFDFMMSFQSFEPTEQEMLDLVHLLHAEIEASRQLERITYESRKPGRDRYTVLHRRLELK